MSVEAAVLTTYTPIRRAGTQQRQVRMSVEQRVPVSDEMVARRLPETGSG